MTAATPITTPSSVSTERSLFTHKDCSAIRMASAMFMDRAAAFRIRTRHKTDFRRGRLSISLPAEGLPDRLWSFRPMAEARTPEVTYNDEVGSWTGRPLPASSDAGRGKSELHRAVCRITSGRPGSSPSDGKCHREYTARVFTDSGKGEKVR